ncbi:exocyst complex component Sec6, partial [Ceraceosorus guamensis]
SPDDLHKLPTLRKKLLKEQSSLSAKLKTGAKDQLEATRDGLLKLQATRRDVAGVREAFGEIEKGCGEEMKGKNAGGGAFRVISEVSQIHRNFVQTATMLDQLAALPRKIESVAHLLAISRRDLFDGCPNLLALHYHISNLETFRNETLQMARTCSSDVRLTLTEYFAPLDGLVRQFEEYLWDLGSRALDLAREDMGGVVVRLVKVIEVESRADEKAAAIRLAKKAGLEGAARFRSVVANARVIKLYRPKLLEAMDRATLELFEECWKRFGASEDGGDARCMEFLEHLDWIYKDLEAVQELLVPLFPQEYNIFRWFVKSYHKHLGEMLTQRILKTDPEASALLELYQFCQSYKKTMTKTLAVDVKWIEEPRTLLDGKEQTIIDDYLSLITRKIDEWIANLMSDEVRTFVSRDVPPEEDGDGVYGMQYSSLIFQMINQQVDLSADSGQASILVRALQHSCSGVISTQQTWSRVLETEFKKQREAKNPQDVNEGLVEYVIALANDQLKSADFGEKLLARMEGVVSEKYKPVVKKSCDDAINGYLDVSKRCTQVLVDLVFADVRPALKDLFTFPSWYTGEPTTAILETIRDYTLDYSERLSTALFDVLLDDLMDRFLTAYIGALRRTSKLRMPDAANRMREDLRDVKNVFGAFREAQGVQEKLEVLDLVISMLTSSATMVFLSYYNFAKMCGPQLPFLEAIMRARDDLEKSDISSIMESARRKVTQEGMSDKPESLISRVEAANSTGLLAAFGFGGGGGGGGGSAGVGAAAAATTTTSANHGVHAAGAGAGAQGGWTQLAANALGAVGRRG